MQQKHAYEASNDVSTTTRTRETHVEEDLEFLRTLCTYFGGIQLQERGGFNGATERSFCRFSGGRNRQKEAKHKVIKIG